MLCSLAAIRPTGGDRTPTGFQLDLSGYEERDVERTPEPRPLSGDQLTTPHVPAEWQEVFLRAGVGTPAADTMA
eukprot:12597750-Alexandrium_andersonii.AAC.1